MSNEEIKTFLGHILESIGDIENYMADLSPDQFLKSKIVQDAVTRRLEIMGEATKNIPKDFRAKYPEVPWQDIAGLRDVLIHHYFGVDQELTFDLIKNDIPNLKILITKLIL